MTSPTAHLPIPSAYDAEDFTPEGLWDVASGLVCSLAMVLDTPAQIAQQVWFSRAEWVQARRWLLAVEGLVRRMLLVFALRLVDTLPHCKTRATAPARKPAPRIAIDLEKPHLWPAVFNPLGRARRHARDGEHALSTTASPVRLCVICPPGHVSSFGFACRLESLRRVIVRRDWRVRRLAFRLRRMRETGAVPDAPPLDPDRSPWGYWHVAHAQAFLEDALSRWREPG